MFLQSNFLDLPQNDLKNGFIETGQGYECIICGFETEKGLIYQKGERLYDSKRYMQLHIEHKHVSIFSYLLSLDKKLNGLSEHQSRLLELFYQGLSDQQIQQTLEIGSPSTVRNHRFSFKEKERQAKIFMVLMELLHERENSANDYIKPHETATMVDDRYKITPQENDKILAKLFPDGLEGKLKTFAIKEKSKLAVLRHVTRRFKAGKSYSEKEINEILKSVYDDYVMIRRYLIEYGFIDRTPDGKKYWLK